MLYRGEGGFGVSDSIQRLMKLHFVWKDQHLVHIVLSTRQTLGYGIFIKSNDYLWYF